LIDRPKEAIPVARERLALIALVLVIPFAVAACGDDDDDEPTGAATTETTEEAGAPAGGGGETITISETEFALDPSDPTAAAGPVTIEVVNDGAIVHNLEVEGNGVEEVTDDLESGQSDTLDLDLEPGTYTIYCNIGDHQAQGMDGTLTVE
jgi:plastocyanin